MENDMSINRTSSSDSNTLVLRKKSTSETIDISQLSFFDELLSIGQFESRVPDAVGLPIEQPASSDRSSESKSVEETSDETDSGKLEASTDSTADPSAYAVLALPQQQLPSQSQSLDPERKLDTPNPIQSAESVTATKNSGPALQSALTTTNGPNTSESLDSSVDAKALPTTNGPSTPESVSSSVDAKASAETAFLNVNSKLNLAEGDGEQRPLVHTEHSSPAKPILKGSASTKTSEAKADQPKSPESNLELKPESIQAVSKTEPTFSQSPVNPSDAPGNTNKIDPTASQPRNRRAERLAQRASENDHASGDSDSSSASAQVIEPVGPLATSETPPNESFFSVTSLVNSSAPITNFSPVIASPSPTSNNLSSTSSNARPSVEGISAVATTTTRGGIQTNTSSTTFSGENATTSNPARTEHGGGEVARSNTGSRISAYQEVKLVQRVLRGVEQLANGGGEVRLRLHPPELGSLQMSLRIEAGQVFAKLEVENSTARDALLNNIQTLRDRMAEQGMKVAAFEVEVSTDSSGSGTSGSNFQRDGNTESQSRWDNATSRFAQQNSNRISSESIQPERKSGAAWTRTSGSLDLTV